MKLHSSTSDNSTDNHKYYYMDPKIHTDYWGVITTGVQYTCKGTKADNWRNLKHIPTDNTNAKKI